MEALTKPIAIKVIGVGGAGCNAVNYLAQHAGEGVSFAVLNTDSQALAQSRLETRLVLGAKTMRGLGAGGDPERGRAAAQEDLPRIMALCEGADIVFVVAGLGGGTGTGASPVIARAAKEKGALVLGIVFLPFEFEGIPRQERAKAGRNELQGIADGIICLPNQKVFKLVDEKTSVLEAFGIANELVSQGVRSLWRMLARPGLINVDFADLCAVTQARHSESALATAEARGENRSREVMEKLLAHPLVDGGQVLAEAESMLVSVTGGPDLTMLEVNRIMEQIHRQAEHAQIIMGANLEEDWRERLSVTLVASRRAARAENNVGPLPVLEKAPEPTRRTPDNAPGLEEQLLTPDNTPRPASRFVPPPPALTPERTDQLLQAGASARQRKNASRMRQGQLPLEIISKGRFEKSEPTIHQGQDLDVPTYIRRGVALN